MRDHGLCKIMQKAVSFSGVQPNAAAYDCMSGTTSVSIPSVDPNPHFHSRPLFVPAGIMSPRCPGSVPQNNLNICTG